MKKYLILFVLLSFYSNGQVQEAKIVYDYTIFWDRIYASLPYLSQAEKDRIKLTWGNEEGYTRKMNLFFTASKSFYTYGSKNPEYTYSWVDDDYIITRDLEEKTIFEYESTLGKTYIIKDALPEYKWRVMNELKEIAGYMCMKAITYDSLKNIEVTAWFCPQINVSVGPERFMGLPGAILGMELATDHVFIEAVEVIIGDFTDQMVLPKKMKGKEVNSTEMDALIKEHIASSIVTQKNPYWAMRY